MSGGGAWKRTYQEEQEVQQRTNYRTIRFNHYLAFDWDSFTILYHPIGRIIITNLIQSANHDLMHFIAKLFKLSEFSKAYNRLMDSIPR